MSEASVSFAGNLTDDPQIRYTESGIARAMFRVAVSSRREQEPSFFTVMVWRDQAEHAAQSLVKDSRVVILGRLQQRTLDRRGWQRPLGRRGRGRGAGAEPAMGDGHHDQDGEEPEPVALSQEVAVK
jgi:single-stranded DNA-binding protein